MTFFKCMLDDPLHYLSFSDRIYRKAERSLGKHVTLSGGVFKSLGVSATAFCYPAFSIIVNQSIKFTELTKGICLNIFVIFLI